MSHDWEENTFAGLEELDSEGHDRLSHLGRADDRPDEPDEIASGLPLFDELAEELGAHPPRLA